MIAGHHVIFGLYGFWLPNDPRGSWSEFVGSDELHTPAGKATTTDGRRSLDMRSHDRECRRAGTKAQARPSVRVDGLQARAIARRFAS